MTVRMRKLLARSRVGIQVCRFLTARPWAERGPCSALCRGPIKLST